MKVAAFIDELFFISKIRAIAEELGKEVVTVRSARDVPADAGHVVVDLSATTFDPIAEIKTIKDSLSIPVTAFVAHVQIDMRERAERAGADEVLFRSAFAQRVTEILRS